MAPHAAGALHERTQVCSRHADRQGHSGRTPHVNDDRGGVACVCLADARARGQTTGTRMHSSCACGRASARTACGYAQLRARRLRALAEAGTRTCMLQAACRPARLCGTTAQRAERTTPPTKAAHPLAAVVHEGVSPAAGAAAPASRAASPARGCCIPAPGRHADAL